MISLLGYVSGICVALCGFPETVRTYRRKQCHLGWGMLLLWFFGEIGLTIYELYSIDPSPPLLLNYILNIIFISIMIYYKVPRGEK